MPDPGVAPVPDVPDGVKEMRLWQQAQMPASQMVQEQANEENLQRQAGMSPVAIDQYWGRSRPASPAVAHAVAANLTRQAAASGGNLDFLTDPVGSVSAMFGLDPKGVKQALDTTADNFTGPIAGAWKGLQTQQAGMWDHILHPSPFMPPASAAAIHIGSTLWAGGALAASPIVGAVNTVGAPAGKALADAGAPLPHVDVDLKSPNPSALFDPSQYTFKFRMATKEEAEAGYGSILTNVGAIGVGEGMARASVIGKTIPPVMPEEMRTLAVDAMRKGEIAEPADILKHGMNGGETNIAVKVSIPHARDFPDNAKLMLGPDASPDAVLRVTHTLQDTWASTGLMPSEIVRRAATDANLREELLTQNIVGEPVAPHTQAAAPKPIPRVGKPEGAGAEQPTIGKPQAGPRFVNSVDESMSIMEGLEGSPDIAGRPQVSKAGAVGRFQIMPSTAAKYGLDPNRLSDPAYNQYAAHTIITDLYRRFDGNMEAMAIAYNAGPGRAQQWLRAGEGTRLEALRDNSVRGGWRYVRVATDRDESFMMPETQEYVARARFKMGKPEGEHAPAPTGDEYTPAPPAEVPSDVDVRNAADDEERAAAQARADEERETIKSGSIGAASLWDNATDDQILDEIGAGIGDQGDVTEVKGMSLYDRAITAIASRLQVAKAIDDLAKKVAGADPEKEFSLLDAFRQAAHSDDRAKVAMGFNFAGKERGGIVVREGDSKVSVIPDSATARGALQQAMGDGGNANGFMRWLVARRAAALESGGVETPINLMAAQAAMRSASLTAKYAKAADQWDAFTKGVRDYSQASGRHSAAQIAGMERTDLGTWVSFEKLAGKPAGVTKRGFTVGSPVKGMKGSSEGLIGDPLSNSLDNVRAMFRAADNNYAVGKLVAMAEEDPKLASLLGIRKTKLSRDPSLSDVEKEMKAFGIPEDKWDDARDAVASLMQDREHLADNEFAYYRDGKKEIWQAGWPELIQMIKGSTPIQAGFVTKLFQSIAHGVQGAVTALPDFAIKQFGSHQMVQFINDPMHPPPFLTGTKGIINLLGMDGLLEKAMANGALGSSIRELDRDVHYDEMTRVLGETGWIDRVRNDISNYKSAPSLSAAGKVAETSVLTPFRVMRAIGERFDMGNRIGLMERGEKAGMEPLKAGAHAAEYGIDYTNRAASSLVNWWSSMVPFMRANLLYTEQAVKAIERNPAAYIASAAIAVTLPKMILFGLNMLQDEIPPGMPGHLPENEKYRNRPTWERLYFYETPSIMGQRMKLRMPDFAAFPFGAVPEAIMMAMYEHDPDGFRQLFTTFIHDYIPPLTPPAAQAPLEIATGTNLETWQPLTPTSMQGAAGQLRYISETSGPAKALAKVLGPDNVGPIGMGKMPPMAAIEHLARGWGAGAGQAVLSALGAPSGRPGAPLDPSRLPFVSSFLVANVGAQKALNDFYEEKARFDDWAGGKGELKREIRRGDTENVAEFGPEAVRMARAEAKLNVIAGGLGKINDALYGIDANKAMPDWEKQQRTNQVTDQYILLARAYTDAMRRLRTGHEEPAETVH